MKLILTDRIKPEVVRKAGVVRGADLELKSESIRKPRQLPCVVQYRRAPQGEGNKMICVVLERR